MTADREIEHTDDAVSSNSHYTQNIRASEVREPTIATHRRLAQLYPAIPNNQDGYIGRRKCLTVTETWRRPDHKLTITVYELLQIYCIEEQLEKMMSISLCHGRWVLCGFRTLAAEYGRKDDIANPWKSQCSGRDLPRVLATVEADKSTWVGGLHHVQLLLIRVYQGNTITTDGWEMAYFVRTGSDIRTVSKLAKVMN